MPDLPDPNLVPSEQNFAHLVELCRKTHLELQSRVKRAIDAHLAVRNWLMGHYIVEFEQNGSDRAGYGTQLLEQLSQELGTGFSVRSLRQFRAFYLSRKEIRQTLSAEFQESPNSFSVSDMRIRQTLSAELSEHFPLSWSHYVALLGVGDSAERSFYEIESRENQWSLRELKRQMNSGLYERLAASRDQDAVRQLSREGQLVETPADLIKSPYVLEFLGLDEKATYSESDLEAALIDQLEHFLLELGKGFLFEARQKRFTFDEDHYFVDLVFYNRLLRCYTLIDLKIGEISHQDLGQMQMYVNYFDRHVKTADEAPTIGIVLCKRKKDALVEITLPQDRNIHASEYQLYLN